MAVRGDTIGRAYVKILADGSGLPKSIRDEFDDGIPAVKKSGEEYNRAFNQGWEAEDKRNKTMEKGLRAKFQRAFGQINADAAVLERGLHQKIYDAVFEGLSDGGDPKHAREVARRVADAMEFEFARTGGLGTPVRKQIDKALDGIVADEKAFETEFRRTMDRTFKESLVTAQKFRREMDQHAGVLGRLGTAIKNFNSTSGKDMRKFYSDVVRDNDRGANRISRFGEKVDRAGNIVGKAFGKGGRNDVLSFFGSFMQAPVEIVGKLVKGLGGLVDMGKNMKTAWSGAGGGFEGLMAAGKQLGPIMSNVYALAGIIGGLVLVGGPVAGLISNLAAAIVALGSAVAFTLGAGLGVLAGLLLPVAAGLGTLGLAFMGMSDKTKKALKESLKPITDQLKDLQEIARGGILRGLDKAAEPLAKGMKTVAPLIQATSNAIGDMIGQFAQGTASPGFKKFIDTMVIYIPDAISSLTGIIKNVASGLGGIFEGVIPITQDFLGWLSGITEEFAHWGQTTGPEDVIGFMETAKGAAEDLWGLITSSGELLGRLLFNKDAAKGGGSILDQMTGQVQDWIDTLKKDPDAFKNWIGDGVDSIKKIGAGLDHLGEMFDKLDTPKNRKAATQVLGLIEGGLGAISTTIGIVSGAWEGFMGLLEVVPQIGVIKQMKDVYDNAVKVKDQIANIDWGGLWNKIPKPDFGKLFGKFNLKDVINPGGVLGAITGPFKGKSGNSLRSMGKFLLRNIINPGGVLGAILSPFRGKASNALKAMGKFLLKHIINPAGILAAVTSPFKGLNDDILKAIGKVALKLLVDVGGAAAAVIAPFRGLADDIVAAIGTIIPHFQMPHINWPKPPAWMHTAKGGMFLGPQVRLIGEAGPEAVVPLARPLSQVDPAVRALSAFAQGKWGAETTNNNQRSLNVGGLTIITPTKDPAAVARETVNRMVAASYM